MSLKLSRASCIGAPLLALTTALGCAGTQRARGASAASVARAEGTATLAPMPAGVLRDRVDAVAAAFRERGAHPLRDRWVTFLPPERLSTLHITSGRAECLGFVAVGRPSLGDVDLEVRNASGVRIARDDRNNAHPFARTCAHAGEELFLVVHAIRGGGELAVLTMTDPPAVPPDLDTVLGVHTTGAFTPPRTPRIGIGNDPATLDAARALERNVQRLLPLGYHRVGATLNGRLEMAHPDGREVRLEAGICYAIVATGGAGVDDLDLRLLTPRGSVLSHEDATDNHPILRTCAVESGAHEVQLRMVSGAGDWSLAVLAMTPAIELPNDVIGMERANSLELAAEARRHGMTLMMAPVRGGVTANQALSIPVTLTAGRCYFFGAAAGETLPGLEIALIDEHHAVLSSDTASREVGHVFHCATRDAVAHVDVRGLGGRGEFNFVALQGREAGRL